MKLNGSAIRYNNGELYIIDQQKLPHEEHWIPISSPEDMISAIKKLKVRGAPMIGISACLSLAQYAKKTTSLKDFKTKALALRESRPTAVNLMNNIDSLLSQLHSDEDLKKIEALATAIFYKDVELCQQMAFHAQSKIPNKANLLTHCNTGGLATAGIGTALGAILEAQKTKEIHVYVDETRPLLQGGRLTAWELHKAKASFTLICDNMAGHLMALGKVDQIWVGADRIATNGDFANKIGTYSLAVLAKHHNIPFYIVAPSTSIDPTCKNAKAIPIEERASSEVHGVDLAMGKMLWAKKEFPTYNPAFDITPSEFVSAWIFETGVYNKNEIDNGALEDIIC